MPATGVAGGHVGAVARPTPTGIGRRAVPRRRRAAGGGKPADAVLEHRPGRARWQGGQGGQDVDVGVPEHVAAIGGAGEAPGSYGRLALIGGDAEQVEHREPCRQLAIRASPSMTTRGVGPAPGPSLAMLGQQPIEPDVVELGDSVRRGVPELGGPSRVATHAATAVDDPHTRRVTTPVA